MELNIDSLAALNKERRKINSLTPREEDFKNKKGYWRKPKMVVGEDGTEQEDPSGAYEWGFKYETNHAGTPTKIGAEVADMMGHSMRAEAEYQQNGGARHVIESVGPREAPRRMSTPPHELRRIARRAGLRYDTAWRWSRGYDVGSWVRERIERAS